MNTKTTALSLLLALCTAAACSSSSQQTEADDPEATASANDESSEESAEAEEETEEKKADEGPVFDPAELVGTEIQDTMPRGCPQKWQKLKGRKFKGELYACDGFRAPHRYREPTVIIGIEEGKIRRVNLQAFYEAGEEITEMYDEVTNDFQSRCDREGGAGGRMALTCDDYLVDISMQKDGGMLNIIYALENWDMPY